jgi:hypothetical protein
VLKAGVTCERWRASARKNLLKERNLNLAQHNEYAMSAQSIQIASSRVLTAMRDGRAWIVELESAGVTVLPVSRIAAARSSMIATLVEAAISAGLIQTRHSPSTGVYSLARYVRWLTGNYVFAGQTPGLFRRAAERFAELGRPALAEFALRKAAEEDGHADLAHRDLEALGLPAAETIQAIQPPSATEFADHFRRYVESSTPVALFGFSYCLERMAVGRDNEFIKTVKAICPPKARSIRFLKVHSNIGSDQAHVNEQLAFFESLPESDLTAIVCAAYETAEILARQHVIDQALTDDEIGRRLLDAGIHYPLLASPNPDRRGAPN